MTPRQITVHLIVLYVLVFLTSAAGIITAVAGLTS